MSNFPQKKKGQSQLQKLVNCFEGSFWKKQIKPTKQKNCVPIFMSPSVLQIIFQIMYLVLYNGSNRLPCLNSIVIHQSWIWRRWVGIDNPLDFLFVNPLSSSATFKHEEDQFCQSYETDSKENSQGDRDLSN